MPVPDARPPRPLSADAVEAARAQLPGWTVDAGALHREFRFADFRTAIAFMVRAGFEADALDHHPEWANRYDRVCVTLRTHSAGNAVTALDVDLAGRLSRIAAGFTTPA